MHSQLGARLLERAFLLLAKSAKFANREIEQTPKVHRLALAKVMKAAKQ